jgi:uncharacterized repeat protein (TIGR03803 family)
MAGFGLGLAARGAAQGLTTIYTFQPSPNGAVPLARLVQGNDGYLYGTTVFGGTNGGAGSVFRISTNGALTSLYSFTGGNDGAYPQVGLVQGSDGYFYGTTYSGGTNGAGTVFRITASGTLTTLHSFGSGSDVANPAGDLVQGSDGSFYGTTATFADNGRYYPGTVFKMSTDGALNTLYSFTNVNDGEYPQAGLVQGSDGDFYGTTEYGGTNGAGTVFKINSTGALTYLTSFNYYDAAYPIGKLVQGSDGYFYGTTSEGGPTFYGGPLVGAGTVFKISTNGALTVYSLPSGGANPVAGLVQGSDGYLYGTTASNPEWGYDGLGTVFKMSTNGALTFLYLFTGGDDGAYPRSAVIQGADGYLYGTTSDDSDYNGTYGAGTVFKISTNGALIPFYSFTGNQGTRPNGLVQGSDGSFYGTAATGGFNGWGTPAKGPFGYGTVFKISTDGVLTSLYFFSGYDGAYPKAALVEGGDGYFYGTTGGGGANGWGTVFKTDTNGALTTLYSFGTITNEEGDPLDGAFPTAALVKGSDGYFYGTTQNGGTYQLPTGAGTVFKISTNGEMTSLYPFINEDGSVVPSGLVQGRDGYFYGTTYNGGSTVGNDYGFGTVFRISTNGALTNLYLFGGGYGFYPDGALVQGTDGSFYGTTYDFVGSLDGIHSTAPYGSIFKIGSDGTFTNLYFFTDVTNGVGPAAGLVQGADGDFYGTTEYGGDTASNVNGWGTVFQLDANGALTVLHSFSGGIDGANPAAALVQASDGSLYGTTSGAELGGGGTVFRLPLEITTASLPWATNGVFYSQQLSAARGRPPYRWAVTSGALPLGLTLATNGLISGTPLSSGTFNFTVEVTDALSATATQQLTLTVVSLISGQVIDDFSSINFTVVSSNSPYFVVEPGSGVFGEGGYVFIAVYQGNESSATSLSFGGGALIWNETSVTDIAQVYYSGPTVLNLSAFNAFRITVVSAPDNAGQMDVGLIYDGTNEASASVTLPTSGTVTLPFSSFIAGPPSPPVDFTHVDSIALLLDGSQLSPGRYVLAYFLAVATPIAPPVILSQLGFGVLSNQFGFYVTGTPNIPIVVEACAHLSNPIWTPLETNAGGAFYLSDPQWTNYPSRFYRARTY